MATEVASLFATLSLRDNLTDGLNKAKGGISGFSDSIKSAGSQVTAFGGSMVKASAPFIAAMGIAVTSAMGFNESMTNIQAVTGQSAAQIETLSGTILDMETRFDSTTLANTFYEVAGGVTDASARMDIFNASVHVAQAGNADLAATTSALIATVNAYGAANLDASYAGDILVQTVAMGKGSMDEFASALPLVTGVAASVGVEFDNVAASMAFLTTQGFSASQAATQLRAIMTSVLSPNKAMADVMESLGWESGQAALEMYGLAGVTGRLQIAMGDSADAMATAFGSTEAFTGALNLNKGEFEAFIGTFEDGIPIATDFSKGFDSSNIHEATFGIKSLTEATEDVQMQSAAAQFDVLKSQIQDVGIEIGTELLPDLIDLAKEAKPVIRSIMDWVRENPQLVRTVALVAGGIAILGSILIPVGMAITAFGSVIGVVAGVFGILLSPIALTVAAVVGLGAAIYFLSGGSLSDLANTLQNAAGAVSEFASGLLKAFQSGGLDGAGQFIQDKLITPLTNSIMNADWNQIAENARGRLNAAFDTAGAIIADGVQWLYNHAVVPIWNAAKTTDWGEVSKDLVRGFFDALRGEGAVIETVSDWVENSVIGPIWDSIKQADKGKIAEDLVKGLWDGIVLSAKTMLDFPTWIQENIIAPVMAELGIASPSTVFFDIGSDIISGLVNALVGGAFRLVGQVASLGLGVVNAFTTGIGDMGAWVTSKIIDPMVGGLNGAVGAFGEAAQAIVSAVTGPFDDIVSAANDVLEAIGLANNASSNNPIAAVAAQVTAVTNASRPQTGTGGPQTPSPSGRQARGGSVLAGKSYWVGEEGPEIIQMGANGRVIPNTEVGGGGGPRMTFNAPVYITGVNNVKELYNELLKEGGRRAPSMG